MHEPKTEILSHWTEAYGDLTYDIVASLLWNSPQTPQVFQSILKRARRSYVRPAFQKYERAWFLHHAYQVLRTAYRKWGPKLTPSEMLMLDSSQTLNTKFRHFDSFFHRLPFHEQFLLLLRDKHGLEFEEIAMVLGKPPRTLELERNQALEALQSWIWGKVSS
jgi:DNA-directed RNA polymerase specialized sigma24 family protein